MAARFVTLIDALYEHRVKLFVTAETSPKICMKLATGGSNSTARSAV
jgi:cell division protein ZapE